MLHCSHLVVVAARCEERLRIVKIYATDGPLVLHHGKKRFYQAGMACAAVLTAEMGAFALISGNLILQTRISQRNSATSPKTSGSHTAAEMARHMVHISQAKPDSNTLLRERRPSNTRYLVPK